MTRRTGLDRAIVALCGAFIAILAVSAYYERDVLLLHIFQSLIYVAILWLSLRHSKWGYGVGISIAALWNTFNLFSGFFSGGTRVWSAFLSTGQISDPVQWVAPLAGIDHLALIVCCVLAYARLPSKSVRDLGILLGSFVSVTVYFLTIIALTWSQFLPRIKEILFGG